MEGSETMLTNITDKLNCPVVRQVLSQCLFDSSPPGINAALTKYPGEIFYGWIEDDKTLGVCGVLVDSNKLEICHIAVAENARGKGIGKAMVRALDGKYNTTIEAETDDDAVGFYRKCGFETTKMYKEYSGQKYRRWMCKFKNKTQQFAEAQLKNLSYNSLALIQNKDGVSVWRVDIGTGSYVLKCFETLEYRREITNYLLLNSLDIPTLKVAAHTNAAIMLEDIGSSV